MNGRRDGKVSIITGAARGISKATAILFAKEGSKVVIADVLKDSGRDLERYMNDSIGAGSALFVETDVSDEMDVKRMVQETVKRFGGIDILVNNAGILRPATLLETDLKTWEQVIDVNLKGAFLCCRYVVPHMIKRGGGVIINVSSLLAIRGGERCVAYAASKGGLIGLTKALARELMQYNIRVNAVAPRAIDTPMLRLYRGEELKERIKNYPFGRIGKPEEVASAILFLASNEASYITGQVLVIGDLITSF